MSVTNSVQSYHYLLKYKTPAHPFFTEVLFSRGYYNQKIEISCGDVPLARVKHHHISQPQHAKAIFLCEDETSDFRWLADIEQAVRLKRQAPLWVGEHSVDACLHIGLALGFVWHEAGLQIAVLGFNVAIYIEILSQVHHF